MAGTGFLPRFRVSSKGFATMLNTITKSGVCFFNGFDAQVRKAWDRAPKTYNLSGAVHAQSVRAFVTGDSIDLNNGRTATIVQILAAINGVDLTNVCFRSSPFVGEVMDTFMAKYPEYFPASVRSAAVKSAKRNVDLADIL